MVSPSHQTATLVGTAVTLGVVHVLTGPDHLSAIATLSANVGNSNGMAFWLGIRWGIGHSTGLLVVGTVFIVLSLSSTSGDDDVIEIPDKISSFFESLVGIFMLLLGAYGVRRAWAKRPKTYFFGQGGFRDSAASGGDGLFQNPMAEPSHMQSTTLSQRPSRTEMQTMVSYQQNDEGQVESIQPNDEELEPSNDEIVGQPTTSHCCSCFDRCTQSIPTRAMAFVAGVIHGLAGPGGVLGVIPAVQLHSVRLATLYLFFFCFTSTMTMGIFAALYGTCSSRLAGNSSRARSGQVDDDGDDAGPDDELEMQTTEISHSHTPSSREFW
eukprot:CAMPEP_0172454656 /NCGR_PEP_ID=MMETSP1065-20121228/11579_1 /TAXON_ID=265537 /ORGANISM="Amphiprora paludosa, Strain CCMP125" /LENGTH=324 /DNA_ID=CAMNT_0013207017 /DNA_START=97 /DNA_END=1068 /DNA_ORIENTATION=+